MIKKQSINLSLLYILMISVCFNYTPFFKYISIILYLVFALLLIFNAKDIFINLKTNKLIIICNFFIIMYHGISKIINSYTVTNDLYSLILFQLIFILFISIKIDINKKEKLISIITILNVILSTMIILNLRGSYMNSIKNIGEYFFQSKNAYAPILSFSIIYIYYKGLFKCSKFISKITLILVVMLGSLNIVIIQSRTNLIMTGTILIIMSIYRIQIKKNKMLYIIPILITIFYFIYTNSNKISEHLVKSLKLDYFLSVQSKYTYGILDAITSGRIESYIYSFNIFLKSMVFGIGYDKSYITSDPVVVTGTHNLWLRAMFYGGILYFCTFITLIIRYIKIIKYKTIDRKLTVFMLLGALINSMFEPFAPLGPGTSYMILWMIVCLNTDDN